MTSFSFKAGCIISAFFFILLLSGCSPAAKEKWLRTLIDGVPGKNKAMQVKTESQRKRKEEKIQLPPKPEILFHVPFLEQLCDSCHDKKYSQKLLLKGKELCFTCHDDFKKSY